MAFSKLKIFNKKSGEGFGARWKIQLMAQSPAFAPRFSWIDLQWSSPVQRVCNSISKTADNLKFPLNPSQCLQLEQVSWSLSPLSPPPPPWPPPPSPPQGLASPQVADRQFFQVEHIFPG